MREKIHPKLLGIFVLSALAVLIALFLAIASGRYFQQTESFVLYFDGSLNGLQIGAPVKFRGVKIGSVSDIKVVLDRKSKRISLPVYITIEADRLTEVGGKLIPHKGHKFMKYFIERGLRARLSMESLVTGMLYVELNLFPESEVNLTGYDKSHFEIPTIPSREEEISGMLKVANKVIKRVKQLIDKKEIDQSIDDLSSIMSNGKVAVIDIKSAAASGKVAFKDVKNITGDLNNRANPIVIKFESVLTELKSTLFSIKTLADYLTRYPEALIRGKATVKR